MIPLAQVDDARADRERLLVPTVVLDPPDDLDLMREEIFGPILPVRAYPDLEAALADVLSATGAGAVSLQPRPRGGGAHSRPGGGRRGYGE